MARYAAPGAFLLAVTIAVLLIRSGLGGSTGRTTTTLGPVTHASVPVTTTTGPAARYYAVQRGDTFGTIAAKERTTVARLQQLNPGVSSSALHIGQRIRVK